MKRLIFVLVGSLSFLVYGQTVETRNLPGGSLAYGYNRFEDRGFVKTRNLVTYAKLGKRDVLDPRNTERNIEIIAAYFFKGAEPQEPITEIVLGLLPDMQTFAGKMVNSIDRRTVYFSPDAEAIFICDGQRIRAGKITKMYGLDSGGNPENSAFFTVPIEEFRLIANASKVEMAVGGVELILGKFHFRRFQDLLNDLNNRTAAKNERKGSEKPKADSKKEQDASQRDLPGYRNGKPIPIDELNGGKPKKP